jgi:hypothetical protein
MLLSAILAVYPLAAIVGIILAIRARDWVAVVAFGAMAGVGIFGTTAAFVMFGGWFVPPHG